MDDEGFLGLGGGLVWQLGKSHQLKQFVLITLLGLDCLCFWGLGLSGVGADLVVRDEGFPLHEFPVLHLYLGIHVLSYFDKDGIDKKYLMCQL